MQKEDSTEKDINYAVLIERTEDDNKYHYSAQLPAEQNCNVWIEENLMHIEGQPVQGHFAFERQIHLPADADANSKNLDFKVDGKNLDIFINRKSGHEPHVANVH